MLLLFYLAYWVSSQAQDAALIHIFSSGLRRQEAGLKKGSLLLFWLGGFPGEARRLLCFAPALTGFDLFIPPSDFSALEHEFSSE